VLGGRTEKILGRAEKIMGFGGFSLEPPSYFYAYADMRPIFISQIAASCSKNDFVMCFTVYT